MRRDDCVSATARQGAPRQVPRASVELALAYPFHYDLVEIYPRNLEPCEGRTDRNGDVPRVMGRQCGSYFRARKRRLPFPAQLGRPEGPGRVPRGAKRDRRAPNEEANETEPLSSG